MGLVSCGEDFLYHCIDIPKALVLSLGAWGFPWISVLLPPFVVNTKGMKKILCLVWAWWLIFDLHAQNDSLLLSVGGVPVTKDEFMYAYRKNQSQLTVDQFLERFVKLKQWVCEAYEWRIDCTPEFFRCMEACRQRLEEEIRQDSASFLSIIPVCQSGSKEARLLAHIVIPLPQKTGNKALRMAEARMDSLYRQIPLGAKLADWIEENRLSFQSGWTAEVVPLDINQLPPDVEAQLLALDESELSMPFYSAAGLHLLQWTRAERKYPESRMEQPLTLSERHWLLQEYHDGLLVSLLRDSLAHVPEKVLEKYYKKHRKQYRWQFPHFKGVVMQAMNAEKLEEAVRYFRDLPQDAWAAEAARISRKDIFPEVKIEYGIFQIGHRADVDKHAFGLGDYVPETDYPCVQTVGKILKRKPESYKDVYERVKNDYFVDLHRKEELKMQKNFKVEINEEVLKTVNNDEPV